MIALSFLLISFYKLIYIKFPIYIFIFYLLEKYIYYYFNNKIQELQNFNKKYKSNL